MHQCGEISQSRSPEQLTWTGQLNHDQDVLVSVMGVDANACKSFIQVHDESAEALLHLLVAENPRLCPI